MASNCSLNWTAPTLPCVIAPPPIIINPSDSFAVTQGFAAYGCLLGVLVFVFVVLVIKMTFKRKRFQTRNAILRQNIARQNQLSTVSYSVGADTNHSHEGENISGGRDATIKIDQPPTYEEVMSNSVHSRERVETSTTSTDGSGAGERTNLEIVGVEVDTISTSEQRSVMQI